MQILIPDSWLREYLDTNATPTQIQAALSLCGPSVERLHKKDKDFLYDVEVTTNRVDCMSVLGLAFECVAVLPRFGYKAKLIKDPYKVKSKLQTGKNVDWLTTVVDHKLCPRFSAVLIRNVKVSPSPDWLAHRLEDVGLRSLNNVVDVSNYLMWEMGQPVHTFDWNKITNSKMIVRESHRGEKLTTLDHKDFSLPGGDIVIEDGSGSLIDLCGIMGGLNSAVDESTKNVLLFVQVYEPNHIRKTSMSLAQRTHAAVLFEKSLPVDNVIPTLERGTELLTSITGGKAEMKVLDILGTTAGNSIMKLPTPLTGFVSDRLGIDLSFVEISKILKSLEFVVKSETLVEVPWARKQDVQIPEDLVEEIARIYGYHNLPVKLMDGPLPLQRDDQVFDWEKKIKYWLSSWGYTETYTYSLVPQSQEGLSLKNPLTEDWAVLRTELHSSHKQTIEENRGRQKEIKLFEIAYVYLPKKKGLPHEQLTLIISQDHENVDHLRGIVEALEEKLQTKLTGNWHFAQDFSYFEANLENAITNASNIKKYIPISKFPPIVEDMNFVLSGTYEDLVRKIKDVSSLIKKVELIDKYGEKLTLRIFFHSDSEQLSSSDINGVRMKLSSLGISGLIRESIGNNS